MMNTKKPNHKCKVCGEDYYYCKSCETKGQFTTWRTMCDTEEHYKIYQVILWYCREIIDEKEAREMLSKCDLSGTETFTESIQQLLDKIFYIKEENNDVVTYRENDDVEENTNEKSTDVKEKVNYKPRKRKAARVDK